MANMMIIYYQRLSTTRRLVQVFIAHAWASQSKVHGLHSICTWPSQAKVPWTCLTLKSASFPPCLHHQKDSLQQNCPEMQNKNEEASLSLAEEQVPSRLAKELSAGSAGMRQALCLQDSVPAHDTTRVYLFLMVLNAQNHDRVIYQTCIQDPMGA